MKKESYLGVQVSPLNYEEILADIDKRIKAGEQSTLIAVNPEKIITAQKDSTLRELINNATYQIPDGIGVVLASKLKGGSITTRVTGIEMMERLNGHAAKKGYKVFLYGAAEEVVTQAKEALEKKYPGLSIVGYENGYIQDNEDLVHKINQSQADILFIAMGSPRQELWIRKHMPHLQVKVFQGVGGSFDVLAGKVKRAPEVFQQFGLEWFYRLISEPKRFKRQLALPKFLFQIMFK
ncbi:WecB/TagA/CpsF family glycosyltransferase [Bacillus sp. 165]|uniref:WecB/TagA/CpsF family glycosyltransferase n=1 Tax=Bacillus sp. 165 TaxID=1529117 RepID=UPI001ADB4E00|nr:WecB/TagA/CpsF family glycosyltransferase [Bacillus sp. 165]MBO9131018.1 WecB/TagA/CpsF family glycosyltransferase [Bacillus sp. 165]